MRASHRAMLFFVTLRLVFGMMFLASAMAHWRVAWYYPIERRWVFVSQADGLAMDWYGRSLLSIAAGAAVGGLAWLLAGTAPGARILGRRHVVRDIAHLGALMLASDLAFYVLSIATRHVTPSPLPAWYCPR